MVLVTAADVDHHHHHQRLGIVCGDSYPDMMADMDQTTGTSLTATTPPPTSSPSNGHRSSSDSCEDTGDGQNDVKKSPVTNGSAFAADSVIQPSGDSSGKNSGFSLYLKTVVKEEKEDDDEEEGFVVAVKQEQELDAPLDFSIKRKESDSDTSRDAQTSSVTRSPSYHPYNSPSSRHSPDTSLQQQAAARSHHYNGSSRDGQSPSPGPVKSSGVSKQTSKSSAEVGNWPSAVAHSPAAALGILAEGSSGGMTPAALSAAVLGQNGTMNIPGLLGEAHKLQAASSGSGGKVQRPFKAYPKDVLKMPLGYLGLPGVSPFPGIDPSFAQGLTVLPEDLMTMYKQQTELLKGREKQVKNLGKRNSRSPPSSALSPSSNASPSSNRNHVTHTSPPPSSTPASQAHLSQSFMASTDTGSSSPGLSTASLASSTSLHAHVSPVPAASQGSDAPSAVLPTTAAPPLVSSTSSVTTAGGNRKRPRNFPDSEKDDAYWERRRKNNDAAKRSRDARRAKEDEIAIRAALLEQENLRLRVEVATLKTETARLRCLLYKT